MLITDSLHILQEKTTLESPKAQPVRKVQWKSKLVLKRDSVVADSLARVDSIARMDSVHKSDSLRAVIEVPKGFTGTMHPSTLHNNTWAFGVMLGLFLLLIISLSISLNAIKESWENFFKVKEYPSMFDKHTATDYYTRLLLLLFSIGVFSLLVYDCFSKINHFSIVKFAWVYGITLLFFFAKYVLTGLVGYVFTDKATFKQAKNSYFSALSFLGFALTPLLLIDIYSSYEVHKYIKTLTLFFVFIAGILIIIKLFQIFFHKTIASFYILLYLCTLEFLPLIILFWAYRLIL